MRAALVLALGLALAVFVNAGPKDAGPEQRAVFEQLKTWVTNHGGMVGSVDLVVSHKS